MLAQAHFSCCDACGCLVRNERIVWRRTDGAGEDWIAICPACRKQLTLRTATIHTPLTQRQIKALWRELEDIPFDEQERIETYFAGFEKGTPREEIWHWFDQHHQGGVYPLLYEGAAEE